MPTSLYNKINLKMLPGKWVAFSLNPTILINFHLQYNCQSVVISRTISCMKFGKLTFTKHRCVLYLGAQSIVFQHKINVCVDIEHMMCFPCLAVLYLCIISDHIMFMCVYFEFTLLSSIWWTQIVSNQHILNSKISWMQASTNLLGSSIFLIFIEFFSLRVCLW